MSPPIAVFVDERPVRVPDGASSRDAVAQFDPALAERVQAGSAYLTDGRGIRLDPAAAVFPGAIIRVVRSARGAEADADA